MAVFGIGIDLVRVDRIGKALERWGSRFEKRVFTDRELEACSDRSRNRIKCLAVRFAAKEAFAKAMGTGIRPPLSWLDIEVVNDESGKPSVALSLQALDHCRSLGVRSRHLSLTDDGEYGAAVVVVET